jgi:hypothetical protein
MLKTIQSWGQKVLAFKKAYVEGRSGATFPFAQKYRGGY